MTRATFVTSFEPLTRFASELAATTPLGLWAAAAGGWTLLEVAAGHRRGWRERALNVGAGLLVLLSMWASLSAVSTITRAALSAAPWRPLVLDAVMPAPLAAVLFLGVYDLAYYGFHRLQHAWTPLWRIHAVHHSAHDLTATAYARQHPTEHVLQTLCVLLPVLPFVALTPAGFAWVALFGAFLQFGAHSALPLSFGPWLISPRLHRIHHAADPTLSGTNFAAFFPAIDILFGTYRAPHPVAATGLHSGRTLTTLTAIVLAPFRKQPL